MQEYFEDYIEESKDIIMSIITPQEFEGSRQSYMRTDDDIEFYINEAIEEAARHKSAYVTLTFDIAGGNWSTEEYERAIVLASDAGWHAKKFPGFFDSRTVRLFKEDPEPEPEPEPRLPWYKRILSP